MSMQVFVQDLGLMLTSCRATTFLIGEYVASDMRENPVFTVADGLLWLYQEVERNSVVRKLQIMKLRGQASVPGLHTFRITDAGLQAFSRTLGLASRKHRETSANRLSMGNAELDTMLAGGIPEGDSLLIAGSSGTGKSLLASQFLGAGIRAGQAGIAIVFEDRPESYVARASSFGLNFEAAIRDGMLRILYLRPLDLSVDETMHAILNAIREAGARRLVIDSLAGFELALAPGFRADFRESLYRMIFALTGIGVTVLSTVEMEEDFTSLPFSTYSVSFLTDDIIRLRYVEIDGALCRIVMVVKMRGGSHSREIREYDITDGGLVIGKRLVGFDGLITGVPTRVRGSSDQRSPGQANDKES
jgi:circadian clock protein KaiC